MNDRAKVFHQLHQSGCFVIPNPWDIGAARLLEQAGFRALATTSSGFAWSIGKRDNHTTLDEALAHYRAISAAVSVPVSADFEHAFADSAEGVAANIGAAAKTGIAGVSLEDSTGDAAHPLYEFDLAVDRVRAARAAIDRGGTAVLLTARCECFLVGRPDLQETIRRLTAYAAAGADCLYAPGLREVRDIEAVVKAVAPKPVNALVGSDFTTVDEMRSIGVRRISVGGALARTAWTGFLDAVKEIAEQGTFRALGRAIPGADLNRRFE